MLDNRRRGEVGRGVEDPAVGGADEAQAPGVEALLQRRGTERAVAKAVVLGGVGDLGQRHGRASGRGVGGYCRPGAGALLRQSQQRGVGREVLYRMVTSCRSTRITPSTNASASSLCRARKYSSEARTAAA